MAVLIVSVPAPFILAMLMNELRSKAFKRTVQTISYLPHFISWVTIASLIYLFLTTDTSGILNNIRELLGAKNRIIFMKYPKNFPLVLSLSSVYKETGWGSIIYLAAISALDVELYEAAAIDGAGRWKQFKHITFPGVLPTTMILLIFAMAGLLSSNFDQIYQPAERHHHPATRTRSTSTRTARGCWGGTTRSPRPSGSSRERSTASCSSAPTGSASG